MLCSEWALVKTQNSTMTVEPLKCKCWTCEYCSPMRSRQLVRSAFMGRPDTFLTLTVNPKFFAGPDDRARRLARAWRLLRLRIMRRYGWKKLPFLAVFEKTKAGEPHLHILLRSTWISQKFVSDTMLELMGAPIIDIRRIDDQKKLTAYVAKYVGKDPTMYRGTKRYWSSRDYELPDLNIDPDEPVWDPMFNVIKMSVEEYVTKVKANNFVVEELGHRRWSIKWDPLFFTRSEKRSFL